jgi:hypothetical protein
MILRITLARLILFAIFLSASILFYLNYTNYFFDRKLEKMANPLLKEVMKVGYYRINKQVCPKEALQMYYDMATLMSNFNGREDVVKTVIGINERPTTTLRITHNENIDKVFNTKKYIPCDSLRSFLYEGYHMNNKFVISGIKDNVFGNFKYYAFYRSTNNCPNCDVFYDYLNKYPNQLFGIKIINKLPVEDGEIWIMKHNRYYYIAIDTNVKQGGHNVDHIEERYLIFKKLTLEELMHYDNGSYWKLIKEYNIKID